MLGNAAPRLQNNPSAAAEARLEKAIAVAQAGDIATASASAQLEANAFPHDPLVLRKASLVLQLCDDPAAALALFKRALAVQKTEIALLHAALGEKEEALRWALQAIACYLTAARLERELGHSWRGLLLLERLYERLPEHVEGNALRGEFLQYHSHHPEAARRYEALRRLEGDDGMSDFCHMRALTEIADYRGVLAHTAQLTPPSGSALEFHAAVFSGHAKLALAVDTAHSVAKAAAMERSTAWLDAGRLAARLQDAIRNRRPVSMIRVGDGEARFLALSDTLAKDLISDYEAKCTVSVIWQNWFGQPVDAFTNSDLAGLSNSFAQALSGADILGVSTARRYERDNFHRGYLGLLERAVDRVLASRHDVSLTDAFANILLHRHSPYYRELLSGLDFLGCISPHPGLAERLARYHGISASQEYVVPGEARLPEAAQGRSAGLHFPDRFHQVMRAITVPRQGAVFLVAAGLLGKIYCHHIRQLGGIAIDVGSIVDAWMGFNTRPGLYNEPEKWVLPIP